MDKLIGFILLGFIIVVIVSFIGFLFSVHWTLGVLGLLFLFSRTI